MATILRSYDFKKPSSLSQHERQQYPWDQWLDGNIWRLEVGEDFNAHPLMMERIIRTRATAKGARINLRHEALNGDVCGIIVMRRADIDQPRAKKAPAKKSVASTKITPSKAGPGVGKAKARKSPPKPGMNGESAKAALSTPVPSKRARRLASV